MIYMHKEKGYVLVLIELNRRFFSFETKDLEMAKFTAHRDFDARDLFARDYEFIGKI